MTNEELVIRIQAGETELMSTLWEQVKRYAIKRARAFFSINTEACKCRGLEVDDLERESFFAIHRAAEKYKADKEAKFLTYAEYHLKSRFGHAAKMTNGPRQNREISLEYALTDDEYGESFKLADTLEDPDAEKAVDNVVEREYLSKAGEALLHSIDVFLYEGQREAITAHFYNGVSLSDYARQKGVSKQRASQKLTNAIEALRMDWDLTNAVAV